MALRDGVDTVLAGLGDPETDGTILGGLADLESGLDEEIKPGATAIDAGVDQLAAKLPDAQYGATVALAKVESAIAAANIDSIDGLVADLEAIRDSSPCVDDPSCAEQLDAVIAGLGEVSTDGIVADLTVAKGALTQVKAGLDDAVAKVIADGDPSVLQLQEGTEALKLGLGEAVTGVQDLQAGVMQIKLGLSDPSCDPADPGNTSNPCGIREGLDSLVGGLERAVFGVGRLAPGTAQAADGASDLADGIFRAGEGSKALAAGLGTASRGSGKLAAGAKRAQAGSEELAGGLGLLDGGMFDLFDGLGLLEDGSGDLADGSLTLEDGLSRLAQGAHDLSDGAGRAADGAVTLADGAEELADGLGDAANGSGRLADGLGQAAAGALAILAAGVGLAGLRRRLI